MGERSDRLKEIDEEEKKRYKEFIRRREREREREREKQIGCGSCEKRRSNLRTLRVPYSRRGLRSSRSQVRSLFKMGETYSTREKTKWRRREDRGSEYPLILQLKLNHCTPYSYRIRQWPG